MRQIEASAPADLVIHLIIDNYCTYKHPKVKAWLAQRQHFCVHHTLTYATLLLAELGVALVWVKIEQSVSAQNQTKAPFIWAATARLI